MIVTRDNYPHLRAAFLEIELDNGAHHVNRIAGAQGLVEPIELDQFTVPDAWAHLVEGAERGLARLEEHSEDDLETFVYGDQDLADEIEKRQGDLSEARILLNGWFNDWPVKDTPFSSTQSETTK